MSGAVSRSSTALILTGTPRERMSATASSTRAATSLAPVMASSRSGRVVSRLMLTPSSPASARAGPYFVSRRPFVVIVTFSTPGTRLSARTKSAAPSLTSGSPPVTRKCRKPSAAKIPARRRNSS